MEKDNQASSMSEPDTPWTPPVRFQCPEGGKVTIASGRGPGPIRGRKEIMEEKKFQRSVPVKLTQEEFVEKGKAMSREQNEMTSLTARLKEVSTDFKAKIAQKEATINSLSITISNGYEYREVDCFYSYRTEQGMKDVVREDTGEIIGTERMTKEDYQEQLPLDGKAA
jgi:hypothetical protein